MIRLSSRATELLLIPMLAVVLPWPVFFRLARYLSRLSFLFGQETQQAAEGAAASNQFVADEIWKRHFRLTKIIDAADQWLYRFRGKGHLQRYVDIEGEWPQQTPFIAASLHFGTGFWVLQHIHDERGPISMVLRHHQDWDSAYSRPMRRYLEACEDSVSRAGGAPIVHTGSGLTQRFHAGIKSGVNQLVLIDVPGRGNTQPVEFLGNPTFFAGGLIGMSLAEKVPIVPYLMMLDFKTGRRRLVIGSLLDADVDLTTAMQNLADFYNPYVRAQSESWQLWGHYQGFIKPGSE